MPFPPTSLHIVCIYVLIGDPAPVPLERTLVVAHWWGASQTCAVAKSDTWFAPEKTTLHRPYMDILRAVRVILKNGCAGQKPMEIPDVLSRPRGALLGG